MVYREVTADLEQKQMENEILAYWKDKKIFPRLLELRKDAPPFVFFEGPPTANSRPGVHHVFARTLKDIVCRYKSMKGYLVERKAGWDTHGLPVELAVEKELGLNTKKDIETYGIAKFNAKCKKNVFSFKKDWEQITHDMGYWLDMEHAYITCENYYIESVWWLLSQFWNAGLMYKDYKILPYCPRCGTGLSDHEVSQGYADVEDPSVYIRFRIKNQPGYFLVWTTTPWTLLSNVALAVNPAHKYVRVKYQGEEYIMVRYRVEPVFDKEFEILEEFDGEKLKDLEYEPLYNYSQDKEKKHYVILADYVTVEDGTGIVHIAPAFGAEDFQEGKKYGLPVVQLVDEEGHIKPEATPFAGKTFKQADPLIIQDLDDRGLLFRKEMVVHSYPHCWRCDSPLLNYARASWYIKTTDYKDKMLAQNIRMTWFPPQIGAGRFGEWLENNVDWALSRERFWGTPLNIWICEKCEHKESIESIKKLGEMARKPLPDDLDLHRPFVDEIILKCPKCGEDMTRVKEIIDCWFDSGAMPYAQYHYPFEEKENWDKRFPAEFICEGLDQTRGWFYTLLAISTFISGESSYKRVMVNGLILDKNGQKMSGSRGNAADPFKIISQYGADPLRWYLVSVSQPWLPIQFDEEVIGEVSRKLFGTLKNVYSFFSMYANIDDFKPDRELNEVKLELIDRWILSRLNSLIKAVETGMEDYQITKTIRRINDFVIDDLSNWYVRRNRRRFWISGFDESKYAAFYVLWKCLLEITRLIAPVVPMTAEWYWSSLTVNKELSYPESVHLADFPAYSDDYIDLSLEEEMKFAIEITASLRAARNKARLKIRQPLRKAIVVESNRKLGEEIIDIIRKEINIKDIEITADQSKLMDLKGDPNFKKLGPKFGGEAPKIAELIKRLSPGDLSHLKEKGELEVTVEEKQLQLTSDLVIFGTQYSPQYTIVEENELVVGLNTELDDELINEGFAREIVNKIQNSRKNADFKVTDRIVVGLISTMKIQRALEIHGDYIKNETLTEEIKQGELRDAQWKEEWNINGEPAAISLKVFG